MAVRDGNGDATAPAAGRRPFGVVVSSAVDGLRTLARKHVELARLELVEAAAPRAQGAGMFAAAGVVALYAVGFLAAAGAAGLAVVLPVWAAILIVAVLLGAVAGILALAGKASIRSAPSPAEKTRETVKEDAAWAKRQIER
jgi:hypothetical protein